jgi:predicted ArsR family transcriptional regulator
LSHESTPKAHHYLDAIASLQALTRSSDEAGLSRSLASRLSQILINQRVILESFDAEKRIEQLEALLEKAGQGKILQLKKASNG